MPGLGLRRAVLVVFLGLCLVSSAWADATDGLRLATFRCDITPPMLRLYASAVRAAFHQRSSQPIELSSLEIGKVHIVNLPGEPMIDFQFCAQGLKPAEFVAAAGYGDCGTGYICPEKAYTEGGYEPTDSNVKPESEYTVKKAIATLLGVD